MIDHYSFHHSFLFLIMRRRASSVAASAKPTEGQSIATTTMDDLFLDCYTFVVEELVPILHETGQEKATVRAYDACNLYPARKSIGVLVDRVSHVDQRVYDCIAFNFNARTEGENHWSVEVHEHTGEPYLEVILCPVRPIDQTHEEREANLHIAYLHRKEKKARFAFFLAVSGVFLAVNVIFWMIFLPYIARAPNTRKTTNVIPTWMEDWGVSVREQGWSQLGRFLLGLLTRTKDAWVESYRPNPTES